MKGDKKNIISERRKPRNPQSQDSSSVDGRDTFQTPDYATNILLPFLEEISPMSPFSNFRIWECACGLGKIERFLGKNGFDVIGTDLVHESKKLNFITDTMSFPFDCIVTNPPFSIKKKFFERCMEYKKPFALLIPADYSGWLIDAVDKYGCEKIIPSRRIDFITPNVINRIHEGEVFKLLNEIIDTDLSLSEFKKESPDIWRDYMNANQCLHNYKSIFDAPSALLAEYSSSYFHSMWLTHGFNLGKSETYVNLTIENKRSMV